MLLPGALVGVFTDDPAVIHDGSLYAMTSFWHWGGWERARA